MVVMVELHGKISTIYGILFTRKLSIQHGFVVELRILAKLTIREWTALC